MVTATALVDGLVGNAAVLNRVAAYLEHKHELKSLKGRDRNAGRNLSERDYGDMQAGRRAGQDAQLNRGVAAQELARIAG